MDGLTEGRIVHYVPNVFDSWRYPAEHRPAIVVKVWRKADGTPPDNGVANLLVFADGTNDLPSGDLIVWRTSVLYAEQSLPGTWHWIEKA